MRWDTGVPALYSMYFFFPVHTGKKKHIVCMYALSSRVRSSSFPVILLGPKGSVIGSWCPGMDNQLILMVSDNRYRRRRQEWCEKRGEVERWGMKDGLLVGGVGGEGGHHRG